MCGLMVARLRYIVTGAKIGNLKPGKYTKQPEEPTRLILAFNKIK